MGCPVIPVFFSVEAVAVAAGQPVEKSRLSAGQATFHAQSPGVSIHAPFRLGGVRSLLS